FVEFVWGLARLPTNDEDFRRTRARLLIKPSSARGSAADEMYPDSEVCFMNITLPAYSAKDILEMRLRRAISESGGHMEDQESMPTETPSSAAATSSSSSTLSRIQSRLLGSLFRA
ncbi:MAG: hypothetical protein Q8P67_01360, partial [archaeon]|nr:hypothetical protein [archaeon]